MFFESKSEESADVNGVVDDEDRGFRGKWSGGKVKGLGLREEVR